MASSGSKTKSNVVVVLVALAMGAGLGWYFTNQHHIASDDTKLAQEQQKESEVQERTVCEATVLKGGGQIKSAFYVVERSNKDGDCENVISYDLPDDTEMFWVGY